MSGAERRLERHESDQCWAAALRVRGGGGTRLAATTARAGQNALSGLKSRPAPLQATIPTPASGSPTCSLPPSLLTLLATPKRVHHALLHHPRLRARGLRVP